VNTSDAIEFLMRVHYNFFMANPRFWYEADLRDADRSIIVAASDLRKLASTRAD
jgi:hypothetical protein